MIFNLSLIIFVLIISLCLNSSKSLKKENSKSIFLIIIFLLLFILIGMREMTMGNDTQTYLNLFKKCSLLKWDYVSFDNYYEGGYIILNVLISYLSDSSRFFMIIMSLIFNVAIYYFIKDNSKNYLFSILMYICLLFFYSSMTMMRQFCAMVIIVTSFKYVKEKKIVKFLLSVILATLFHSTAWIALLIYPIYNLKHNKKTFFLIILCTIIATLFLEPIINIICDIIGRENYYMDRLGSESIANILYTLTYLSMYVFGVITSKKNSISKKENDFYLLILLMATAINFIAINMNILSRAALYFNIFSIIALPNLLYNNIKNDYTKKVINIVLVIILVIYSSIIIKLKPEWNSAYNYKSCIIVNSGDICK